VARFEEELIPFVHGRIPDFDAWVLSGRKLDDEQLDRLKSVIAEYAASFE